MASVFRNWCECSSSCTLAYCGSPFSGIDNDDDDPQAQLPMSMRERGKAARRHDPGLAKISLRSGQAHRAGGPSWPRRANQTSVKHKNAITAR